MNKTNTHPGLNQTLEKGCLTVKCTSKSFSRVPVGLAVEQTVNADGASRLTGISAFTNSITARNDG